MQDVNFTVFVYGTLKKNCRNHYVLNYYNSSKFLGAGYTKNKYPMISLGAFPAVINQPGWGHNIKGELYSVDEKTLAILDQLEGHPLFYQRELTTICSEGQEIQAYVYFISQEIKPKSLTLINLLSEW